MAFTTNPPPISGSRTAVTPPSRNDKLYAVFVDPYVADVRYLSEHRPLEPAGHWIDKIFVWNQSKKEWVEKKIEEQLRIAPTEYVANEFLQQAGILKDHEWHYFYIHQNYQLAQFTLYLSKTMLVPGQPFRVDLALLCSPIPEGGLLIQRPQHGNGLMPFPNPLTPEVQQHRRLMAKYTERPSLPNLFTHDIKIPRIILSPNEYIKAIAQAIKQHEALALFYLSQFDFYKSKYGNELDINVIHNHQTLVILSVEHERYDVLVKLARDCGADVNKRDGNRLGAIETAVIKNNKDMVIYLLNHGAEVNRLSADGKHPLFLAIELLQDNPHQFQMIECLITKGADIDLHCNLILPSQRAQQLNQSQIVAFLRAQIAMQAYLHHGIGYPHYSYLSPIVECMRNGDDMNAQLYLSLTPSPETWIDQWQIIDFNELTLIMYAAQKKLLRCVLKLIELGANIHLKNRHGKNVLHYAVETQDTPIVTILMNQQVNAWTASKASGIMPIHIALANNDFFMMKCLINHAHGMMYCETNSGISVFNEAKKNPASMAYQVINGAACAPSSDLLAPAIKMDNAIRTVLSPSHPYKIFTEELFSEWILNGILILPVNSDQTQETAYGIYYLTSIARAMQSGWADNVALHLLNQFGFYKSKLGNHLDINTLVEGKTLVMISIVNDHFDVLTKLVRECGADVNVKDINKQSALDLAVQLKKKDAVIFLAQHGAKLHAKTPSEPTPLCYAIIAKDFELVQVLVQYGAEIPCEPFFISLLFNIDCPLNISHYIRMQWAAQLQLYYSSFSLPKTLEKIHALIQLMCDENDLGAAAWFDKNNVQREWIDQFFRIAKQNITLIMYAAKKGLLACAKKLRESGANIHLKNHQGKNVLHFAAENKFPELVQYFLNEGVDCFASASILHEDKLPIHLALHNADLATLKVFILHTPGTIYHETASKISVFNAAASKQKIKTLITECAQEFKQKNERKPASSPAVNNSISYSGVKAKKISAFQLVEYPINPFSIYKYIQNLFGEIKKDEKSALSLLNQFAFYKQKYSSNLNINTPLFSAPDTNTLGKTLILYAIENDRYDVLVKLVKECGADVNVKSIYYGGALETALQLKKGRMVSFLVQHGANVNARMGDGNHLLHLAIDNNCFEHVQLLVEHGADLNVLLPPGKSINDYAQQRSSVDKQILVYLQTQLIRANQNSFEKFNRLICVMDSQKEADRVQWLQEPNYPPEYINKPYFIYGSFVTLIMYAAKKGLIEFVKTFRKLGANIHFKNRNGENILHFAVESGSEALVQYCLDEGVSCFAPTVTDKSMPIHIAFRKLNTLLMKRLIIHEPGLVFAENNQGVSLFSVSTVSPMIQNLLNECIKIGMKPAALPANIITENSSAGIPVEKSDEMTVNVLPDPEKEKNNKKRPHENNPVQKPRKKKRTLGSPDAESFPEETAPQPELKTPSIITFDAEQTKRFVKTALQVYSDPETSDCHHLATYMLNCFRYGKTPDDIDTSRIYHFDYQTYNARAIIKQEKGFYSEVTQAIVGHVENHEFPLLPRPEIPATPNGTLDVENPLIRYQSDGVIEHPCHYEKLNKTLQDIAKASPNQVVYALINLRGIIKLPYILVPMGSQDLLQPGHIQFECNEKSFTYRFKKKDGEVAGGKNIPWEKLGDLPATMPRNTQTLLDPDEQFSFLSYFFEFTAQNKQTSKIELVDKCPHQIFCMASRDMTWYVDPTRDKNHVFLKLTDHFRFLKTAQNPALGKTYGDTVFYLTFTTLAPELAENHAPVKPEPSASASSTLTTTTSQGGLFAFRQTQEFELPDDAPSNRPT